MLIYDITAPVNDFVVYDITAYRFIIPLTQLLDDTKDIQLLDDTRETQPPTRQRVSGLSNETEGQRSPTIPKLPLEEGEACSLISIL